MKKSLLDKISPAFIILAGIMGGIMVIFVRELSKYGFSSMQITALRFLTGVSFLGLFMLFFDKESFKIDARDIFIFLLIGIFSCISMSALYFAAVVKTSAATAVTLMYTAPIWVLIVSAIIYKEPLTVKKITALILAFGGCVCVSGFSGGEVSAIGMIYGVLSSFAYAAYSLAGKKIMKKYKPFTMTFYSYLFAMIGAWCICDAKGTIAIVAENISWKLIVLSVFFGILTMSVLFSSYNIGLSHLPAGKAAIMSLTEPMVATLVGVIVYRERLGFWGISGVFVIIFAMILLNIDKELRKTDSVIKIPETGGRLT